jgi:hypothetical protein
METMILPKSTRTPADGIKKADLAVSKSGRWTRLIKSPVVKTAG